MEQTARERGICKWFGPKGYGFITRETVKLPTYNLSQTVMLKSNGFLVVSFTVP